MATGGVKSKSFLGSVLTAEYTGVSSIPTKARIGIGTTTASEDDTALEFDFPVTGTELCDACETAGNWTATTDGSVTLNSTSYKEGAGSLNLVKSGTANATVTYYSNNLMTSRDFTSKDLLVWVYIKDATTLAKLASSSCLELRYGNDYNTNYYSRTYNAASLSTGWNLLKMSTASGTLHGTVALGSCDSGALVVVFTSAAQTLVAGDLLTDEWRLASSDDYDHSFQAGYPTVSASELKAEERIRITTTEANGAALSEFATYDAAGNQKCRGVFSRVSKTDDELLICSFITKARNAS